MVRRDAAPTAARPRRWRADRPVEHRTEHPHVPAVLVEVDTDRRPGGVTLTADDRRDLARQLTAVAAILDARGFPLGGVVRRAAVELATHVCIEGAVDNGCPDCGGPVVQPARGRPRTYCSPACRKRAARRNAA